MRSVMLAPMLAVCAPACGEWVCARDKHEVLLLPLVEANVVAPILGNSGHLCGNVGAVRSRDTTRAVGVGTFLHDTPFWYIASEYPACPVVKGKTATS